MKVVTWLVWRHQSGIWFESIHYFDCNCHLSFTILILLMKWCNGINIKKRANCITRDGLHRPYIILYLESICELTILIIIIDHLQQLTPQYQQMYSGLGRSHLHCQLHSSISHKRLIFCYITILRSRSLKVTNGWDMHMRVHCAVALCSLRFARAVLARIKLYVHYKAHNFAHFVSSTTEILLHFCACNSTLSQLPFSLIGPFRRAVES